MLRSRTSRRYRFVLRLEAWPQADTQLHKVQQLRLDGRSIGAKARDCDRQFETSRSCAARVKKEQIVSPLDHRLVRMPVDDGRNPLGGRIDLQIGNPMQH